MYVTKIGSLTLASVGAEALLTSESRPIEFDNRRRQRSDASQYTGASLRPGEWDVRVKLPTAAARDALIAQLDRDLSLEIPLEAMRDGTVVIARAPLRRIDLVAIGNQARLTFEPSRPTWRAATPVTTSSAVTGGTATITVAVPGNMRTAPIIRVQPTAQRASQTATVGWKRRRRFRVTNNSDETWYRMPLRIELGDTTGLVTGLRAQANGSDYRVRIQGREVARTLVGWNTVATYAWILVPVLRPGASLVVEFVWHNSAATANPPVLAYPDIPAFDLAASSNGVWRYQAGAGQGLWWLSTGAKAPDVDTTVPGAWQPVMTLANPDNVDDVTQYPYSGAAPNIYAPFNAMRAITGGVALPSEGLADGVTIHHPCGITGVSAAISYRNDYTAGAGTVVVGKFVVLARTTGAQVWDKIYENGNVVHASYVTIARATYAAGAPVRHVAFAVWPYNEVAVDEAALVGRVAHMGSVGYIDVFVDETRITIAALEPETEIYDVAVTLSVDPDDGVNSANSVRLGAAGSTDASDVPRLAVKLNEQIVIDCETRAASVWNSALTAKIEDVPHFAIRGMRTQPILGIGTDVPASEWLPLRPAPGGRALTVSETAMGTLAIESVVTGAYIP